MIAAAVVGGASLTGGRGTAIGALLGTLVIALIENGIIILRLAQEYRLIIIGLAIIVAVSLDRLSTYMHSRRQVEKGGFLCATLSVEEKGQANFSPEQQPRKERETPRMKTNYLITTTVAAAIAGLAIFGPAGAQAEEKKKVLLGFVAKSLSNDVFQAAQVGAADAAKELGPKYNAEVQLEIRTPNDEDATKQAEAIEALARMGAQGIAVSCSEANTVTPSIDKAVSRGVQVMCFDSDAPNSKRFAYYGTDDKSCGERTVELPVEADARRESARTGRRRSRRRSSRAGALAVGVGQREVPGQRSLLRQHTPDRPRRRAVRRARTDLRAGCG